MVVVCLASLALPDLLATPASLDATEPTARLVCPESHQSQHVMSSLHHHVIVHVVLRDLPDLMELPVKPEIPEHQDVLDRPVHLVVLDPKDHPDPMDKRETMEYGEILDSPLPVACCDPAHPENLEMQDPMVLPVSLASPDPTELMAHLELKAQRDHLAIREKWAVLAVLVNLATLVMLESLVSVPSTALLMAVCSSVMAPNSYSSHN